MPPQVHGLVLKSCAMSGQLPPPLNSFVTSATNRFPFLKAEENHYCHKGLVRLNEIQCGRCSHGYPASVAVCDQECLLAHTPVLCSSLSPPAHTHIFVHTGLLHSSETRMAIRQVPENKVPFTLLPPFFLSEPFQGGIIFSLL